MKAIILAAGYATRLYPKTLNIPKCLLEYNDKPVLDYLIEDLINNNILEIIIVSNHKFYDMINNHILKYKYNIKVIDDKSIDEKNRLGAVRDLIFTLNNIKIDDDYIIMASDNILTKSLKSFINSYNGNNMIMYYKEYNEEKLKSTGQALFKGNELIRFYEKSKQLITNNACPPFYIFNKNTLNIIKNSDLKADSLGLIIGYLIGKTKIYGYLMKGKRIDIKDILK